MVWLLHSGRALVALGAVLGRLAGWLLLPMMLAVLGAVVGSQLRLGELVRWGVDLPLLGTGLTITGLTELQWHLFTVLVMLGGSYALAQNGHVRVDFLYDRLSTKGRYLVDLLGHLLLLLPFCALVAWLAWPFIELAYRSGEQSDYGGLTDRYLIKAVLPVGLAMLFITATGQVLISLGVLLGADSGALDPKTPRDEDGHHG
ncbi:MAG: TRAP transporter small permease subunit [Candidatus Competibacterales bacterium]